MIQGWWYSKLWFPDFFFCTLRLYVNIIHVQFIPVQIWSEQIRGGREKLILFNVRIKPKLLTSFAQNLIMLPYCWKRGFTRLVNSQPYAYMYVLLYKRGMILRISNLYHNAWLGLLAASDFGPKGSVCFLFCSVNDFETV